MDLILMLELWLSCHRWFKGSDRSLEGLILDEA